MSRKRFVVKVAAGVGSLGLLYYAYQSYVDKNKKLLDNQHVVIIGGGYGGTRLAHNLKGRGNFTLIDSRDAMHHNMAALRAAVEPNFSHKSFIPFDLICKKNFVQGKVTSIDVDKQEVVLENTLKRIPYSQLVIATGSSGPFPGKCSVDLLSKNMIEMYENFTDEIKRAKSIVIVGGGAVGVELAGEIATDYPDQKTVTVVHNSNKLVAPVIPQEAVDIINKKFSEKKIDAILDDKVTNLSEIPANQTCENILVTLQSGKVLKADLVVPCYGLTVNSDAYKDALSGSMNAKGQLKVDEMLQVKGTKNIFAIGDCNDYNVGKLAVMAQEQATATYNNLINIAQGKPLQPFRPSAFKLCVPIGRDGGFTMNGTKVFGDFLTKMIKARDVFVKFTWKGEFGLQPPK